MGREAGGRAQAFPGLLTVLFALLAITHASDNLPCKKFSQSERILIGRDSGNVVELHIRHNIQGEIEIRDGSPGDEFIKLEIDKTAAARSLLENVITNRTVIDIGYGTVYMLQVDYTATSTRIVTIIISAVIAAVIFLALLSVLIWWYCKVERQRFRASAALPIQGLGPVDPVLPDGEERYVESTRSEISPAKTPVGPSGVGSPRGMNRTSVVTLSIITAVSVVYAGCSIEPQVHIIVFIPPVIKLHSVKVYFNKIHENPIETKQWSFKNTTEIAVFDLLDASPTDRPPCNAEKLCPYAQQQNLAGCDAATNQCICQRGYELSGGVCTDLQGRNAAKYGGPGDLSSNVKTPQVAKDSPRYQWRLILLPRLLGSKIFCHI